MFYNYLSLILGGLLAVFMNLYSCTFTPFKLGEALPVTSQVSPLVHASSNLDNATQRWWLVRAKDHALPRVNTDLKFDLASLGGVYVGDTSKPILYLTFDEGYENGYTSQILDTLKTHQVPAVFFCTATYIKRNPELVLRMYSEGHIVANHSTTHPSMPSVAGNPEKFNQEILTPAQYYEEITGAKMIPLFRPPMGEYSEKSLAMTKELGYQSVFWSLAYHDWDPKKQPEPTASKKLILDNLHNGAIMLLHPVSKTNTEILGSVIEEAKKMGYSFELVPH